MSAPRAVPDGRDDVDLAVMVVDWLCALCGAQTTTRADWRRDPLCPSCGEGAMVDLWATVRPAESAERGLRQSPT